MLLRLVHAGVITGKVVDDRGGPMIGVTVTVLHKPSEEELEDAGPRAKKIEMITASVRQTDDRSEYRIFGLKPCEYYSNVTGTGGGPVFGGMQQRYGRRTYVGAAPGRQLAPMYFPGVLRLDQAQAVMFQAGEETQADFAMRGIKLVEVASDGSRWRPRHGFGRSVRRSKHGRL